MFIMRSFLRSKGDLDAWVAEGHKAVLVKRNDGPIQL
jgi:hypothetical protein